MAYYVAKILNGQPFVIEKNDTSVVRSLDFDFETGDISPVGTFAQEALIVGNTVGQGTYLTSTAGTNVIYASGPPTSYVAGEYCMITLDDGRQYWSMVTNVAPAGVITLARNIPVQATAGNRTASQQDCSGATDFTIVQDFKERKFEGITSNSQHLRTTNLVFQNKQFKPVDVVMADISSYLDTGRAATEFKMYSVTGESYTFASEDDLQNLLYQLSGYLSNIIDGKNTLVNQIWDAANTQAAMDAIVDNRTDTPPTLTAASFPVVRYTDTNRNEINGDIKFNNVLGVGDKMDFTKITSPSHSSGQLYFSVTEGELNFDIDASNVTMSIGREMYLPPRANNGEALTITNGQVVYISGSTGTRPIVKLAKADAESTADAIGLVTESGIVPNNPGYVTTYGLVKGVNTSSFSAGDSLYVSTTTAGGLQNTIPSYPNFASKIGYVINSDVSDGIIMVTHPKLEVAPGSSYTTKSYSIADYGSADYNYMAGYYAAPAADTTLTIGGSQTYGAVNRAVGAHAFIVAGGAGGTSQVLTVSGTSITDAGVRTAADSEVIVADVSTASTDDYYETSKKWIGQITFTLTGPPPSVNFDFNYGFCKYEDFGNRNFTVSDFEIIVKGAGNTGATDMILYHHQTTGWTYSATAFLPGSTPVICSMQDDYVTETQIYDEEYCAYKRSGLSTVVNGSASEGIVIVLNISDNNALRYGTSHIGVYL